MSLEKMPGSVSEEKPQLSGKEYLKLKDTLFRELVADKMVETYDAEMQRFGFTAEDLYAFREKVLSLTPEQEEALYAFPWELKQRALPTFLKKIRAHSETVETMVDKIIEASKAKKRTIAFHASNENIQPKDESVAGKQAKSWVIFGKEKDHRDADLPMAYYSFDYMNLYRVKDPKYIYVVSIQADENSGHRKDGNNEWGRAPSLSVIEKLDLESLERQVTELADTAKKKGQQ